MQYKSPLLTTNKSERREPNSVREVWAKRGGRREVGGGGRKKKRRLLKMRAKVEWVADGTRGWRTRRGVQVYPAPTTTTTDPLLPLFCFRTSPLMDGHVTNTHTHTVNRHTQTQTHTHETWSAATSRSFDSLLRALSSSLHSNFKSATRQFEKKIHPHTHTRRTIDAIGLNRTSQSSSQLVLVLVVVVFYRK